MVQTCSAINCKARRTRDVKIKFHRLPINPTLREKWLEAINRLDFKPGKTAAICEKHFKEDDYEINPYGNRCLKKGAVPSVFNSYNINSHKKPKIKYTGTTESQELTKEESYITQENARTSAAISESKEAYIKLSVVSSKEKQELLSTINNASLLKDLEDTDSEFLDDEQDKPDDQKSREIDTDEPLSTINNASLLRDLEDTDSEFLDDEQDKDKQANQKSREIDTDQPLSTINANLLGDLEDTDLEFLDDQQDQDKQNQNSTEIDTDEPLSSEAEEQETTTTKDDESVDNNIDIPYSSRKRIRSDPVYFGDFQESDLDSEIKRKRFWKVAQETVSKFKKLNEYYRCLLYKKEKKIEHLHKLFDYLMQEKQNANEELLVVKVVE